MEFIGVAGRDDVPAMQAFIDRHGLDGLPHIADLDGSVWRRFGIAAQPAWVFVDGGTGERRTVHGALDVPGLEAELERLMATVSVPAGP